MTTTAPSTALATIQPSFTDPERLALAGYLAGYRGLTREAYTLDLRQFTGWCRSRSLSLFSVRLRRHRKLRPATRSPGPGPRHGHPAPIYHRRVLQVRRRRGAPGSLARCACPAAARRL